MEHRRWARTVRAVKVPPVNARALLVLAAEFEFRLRELFELLGHGVVLGANQVENLVAVHGEARVLIVLIARLGEEKHVPLVGVGRALSSESKRSLKAPAPTILVPHVHGRHEGPELGAHGRGNRTEQLDVRIWVRIRKIRIPLVL